MNLADLGMIGTVAAAMFAAAGLFFIAFELRRATRRRDLDWLFRYREHLRDTDSYLAKAEIKTAQHQAYMECMSFLEVSASAYNKGLLPESSTRLVRAALIERLAAIAAHPVWSSRLQAAVTQPSGYLDVISFMQTNINDIEKSTSQIKERHQYTDSIAMDRLSAELTRALEGMAKKPPEQDLAEPVAQAS